MEFEASRLVDTHAKLDLATFEVKREEVARMSKTILTGRQKTWPPSPPVTERGVYLAGFPGRETTYASTKEISFGAAAISGVASSVSDRDVSMLIERERLVDVFGLGGTDLGL
jgi:hypothetical protein